MDNTPTQLYGISDMHEQILKLEHIILFVIWTLYIVTFVILLLEMGMGRLKH